MRIYSVAKVYDYTGNADYIVMPHRLSHVIRFHFKFNKGLRSLIPYLKRCRLTKRGAEKLALRRVNNG